MADIETKLSSGDAENVLTLARERREMSYSLDKDAMDDAVTDLKMVNGDQWPQELLDEREPEDRPCLVLDKINEKVRQVIGDHRQNRQQIKVNPVDDDADTDTADVLSGAVRNIEYQSHAASVYTTGLESTVRCGRGFWRIATEYANDDDFDQEIYIRRVPNITAVAWDQNSQDLFWKDALYTFLLETIGPEEFKHRFGNRFKPVSIADTNENKQLEGWLAGDSVRIAEYCLKVPDPDTTKTLYLVATGKSADGDEQFDISDRKPADKTKLVKQRKVKGQKIISYVIDGKNILSGPHDWVSRKHFPIVPVWGEEIFIEGVRYTRGLVRLARDPQKMLNYFESMVTEAVALAPKAPWVLTATQLGEHQENYWNKCNTNISFLLYDGDPEANGMPRREQPVMIPSGYEQRSVANAEHIKSATGIYNASVGAATSRDESGRAIEARQREGDVGTYVFLDNLSWAIRHTGTVLVDIIPKVYDTQQVRRIIGEDGEHKRIHLANAGAGHSEVKGDKGEMERIYDLSVGKYDVAVTTGPSFSTKRKEAAQAQMELVKAAPEVMQCIGDMMVKSQDWPDADKVADRMKHYLHPAIQAQIAAEEDAEEGSKQGGMTPEVAAAMQTAVPGGAPEEDIQQQQQQPEVDPAMDIKLEQERMKLDKMKYEAEQAKYQMLEAEAKAQAAGVKVDSEEVKLAGQYAEAGVDPDQAEQELETAGVEA